VPPSRAHGALLLAGFLPAAVLLGRLTYDLGGLDPLFAVPVWGFYAGFVGFGAAHVVTALRGRSSPRPPGAFLRWTLILAAVMAPVASILDCMGLAFTGCTVMCTILMQGVTPVLGALILSFAVTGKSGFLTATSGAALLLLLPNCVCYNPINGFWIDAIGYSPACFAGAFGVVLLCAGALRTGTWGLLSAGMAWGAVVAMLGFFVGHHYFDWPW
jgi:hypothetical protein